MRAHLINAHMVGTVLGLLVPVFALGFDIEPKRPLSPAEDLKMVQDARSITVSGETFAYTFRKDNGLIGSVQVLGRNINGETPIPDLIVAEQFDPAVSPYAARNESQARVTVVSADPARVVIRAEGAYTSKDGRRFPLRYAIGYEIGIDGVILVSVNNTAVGDCTFRWLLLSAGEVRSDAAKFLNWMPEQSGSQTTDYKFRPISTAPNGTIVGGIWLPWIWIGDQTVGLEVTTWDVSSQTYNRLDSTIRKDEPEMFSVRRQASGVRWENYLVRRSNVFAKPGWTRGGQFALAVTPSKKFDPYFAMIKGAHLGPHQHDARVDVPDEQKIRTMAQNGVNLIVGIANWRSGEYVALNDADLRKTIALCHKYGVKIIPYITLVDLSHATETFREHGEEWSIEPTTEFCRIYPRPSAKLEFGYRNDPEKETTLMCPGAEGWRTHWKRQIDRVINDYDFDGIYFDFWYGRMVCENTRHGCGGRFRKATVLGSREMLMYAYNRIKAKNPHGIIKANTNMLATALITSLADIRLVGEATDATQMDPASRQWLYSSHRLGEPTEFLWDQTRWNPTEKASFATLVSFLPQYYQHQPVEHRTAFDDFDVFRSFDDGKGSWQLGIGGQERLRAKQPEVQVNLVKRDGAMLATLINTRLTAITAELPVSNGWIAYEPLGEQILPVREGIVKLDLPASAHSHVLLSPVPARPRVLFALGARQPAGEKFDASKKQLRLSVEAAEGTRVRFSVYAPERPKSVMNGGDKVPFEWTPETRLARFEIRHVPGSSVEMSF